MLTVALATVLGLISWLVTAQGQADAFDGSGCPNDTACRLESGFATDSDEHGLDDEGVGRQEGGHDSTGDDTSGGGAGGVRDARSLSRRSWP
jgi:hypothetical protein